MFWRKVKTFFCALCAIAVAVGFCAAYKTVSSVKLAALDGERFFYLDSASSQALCKRSLRFCELSRVRGESVHFEIGAGEKETLAKDVAKVYGAEIVAIEEACGVISYYAYAPKFQGGVLVNGKRVNLHIAVSETQAAVGTPIIFGGF